MDIDIVDNTQETKDYMLTVVDGIVKPYMQAELCTEVFMQDGTGIHKFAEAIAGLDKHVGIGKWTAVSIPPFKEISKNGTFTKVAKTSKKGKFGNTRSTALPAKVSPQMITLISQNPPICIVEHVVVYTSYHFPHRSVYQKV